MFIITLLFPVYDISWEPLNVVFVYFIFEIRTVCVSPHLSPGTKVKYICFSDLHFDCSVIHIVYVNTILQGHDYSKMNVVKCLRGLGSIMHPFCFGQYGHQTVNLSWGSNFFCLEWQPRLLYLMFHIRQINRQTFFISLA